MNAAPQQQQSSRPLSSRGNNNGGRNRSNKRLISPLWLVLSTLALALTFYAGVMTGMHTHSSLSSKHTTLQKLRSSKIKERYVTAGVGTVGSDCKCDCSKDCAAGGDLNLDQNLNHNSVEHIEELVEARVQAALAVERKGNTNPRSNGQSEQSQTMSQQSFDRFTPGMATFAAGAAYTKKDKFMEAFDYGFPLDNYGGANEADVLLLYDSKSLPLQSITKQAATKVMSSSSSQSQSLPFIEDPVAATAQCQQMNVVVSKSPCLAILWQYESYHVERWARIKNNNQQQQRNPVVVDELIAIGRGRDTKGKGDQFSPPSLVDTKKHWSMLQDYLDGLDDLVAELRPITERIKIQNTVIVMVCNHGQSPLLMNFACSSRARGLDISNILVFATDRETLELAESLGMSAYYDEKNFGDLPNNAARAYADRTFKAMMFAKVVSVQIINFMGYDVLFQDVDVHWYKNPLDVFHNTSSALSKFDMMFQDDGARSLRYAPYSANSGFYYVRYNDRTRYLFISLLVQSDMIVKHASHQQVLVSLLTEHASLTGLRVKVLTKDDYPGGFDYHRRGRWNVLRKIQNGEAQAEIFHMSWTANKDNKLLFMRQMGMWHLEDQCIMKTVKDIDPQSDAHPDIFNACCSVEPLITCHYRDKPSVVNCNHKNPIDAGKGGFWIET